MTHVTPGLSEPLYRAQQIRNIERRAVEITEDALFHLMLNAGQAAFSCLQKHWPNCQTVAVIAGSGNNAGDGFVLARLAYQAGFAVKVLTVRPEPVYQGDALKAFQALKELDIEVATFAITLLEGQDLIVDCILGTGLTGALRPDFEQVIEAVNSFTDTSSCNVLALDIPSGLHADTGCVAPTAIRADHCLTFINMKTGMVTAKARDYCESFEVADLGIHPDSRLGESIPAYCNNSDELIHLLPRRSRVSHKGTFGHLLLIGGDYGFGGAILMSAMAAARTGVGKLTILTRDVHVAPIMGQFPEAMIRSIESPQEAIFEQLMSQVDAVVIGPGLGTEDWGTNLLTAVLQSSLPLLIDADGLNLLANREGKHCNWVLTPHPGEAGRLLHVSTRKIESDRYDASRLIQEKYSGVVVLKGAGTIITDKDLTTVCTEGNPGMASAGMGDILSGVIGSLLAQGLEPSIAARVGTSLHALSGDMAAEKGEKGLVATDLLEPLRYLVNN